MKHQRKTKRILAVWQIFFLLTIGLTISCYSGSAGELYPQVSDGYKIVDFLDKGNTAQLAVGEATLNVWGSWYEGHMNLVFDIKNNSTTPFQMDFQKVKIEIQNETTKTMIHSIFDTTNDKSGQTKRLYEEAWNYKTGSPEVIGRMTADCPPKQNCSFIVNVNFPGTKLNKTKSVKVTVPPLMETTKTTEIIFDCRKPSLLPYF